MFCIFRTILQSKTTVWFCLVYITMSMYDTSWTFLTNYYWLLHCSAVISTLSPLVFWKVQKWWNTKIFLLSNDRDKNHLNWCSTVTMQSPRIDLIHAINSLGADNWNMLCPEILLHSSYQTWNSKSWLNAK